MRILYGVVGDGMGHATRSGVVIDHLLATGHEVTVVSSRRAHGYLADLFSGREAYEGIEIRGLSLRYRDDRVDQAATVVETLLSAPADLRVNRRVASLLASRPAPDVVFSDFESFAGFFGHLRGVPVVSVDNLQMLVRGDHPRDLVRELGLDFHAARAFARLRLSGAYHYVVTTFFFPPPRRPRTTFVPPILRPEILAAHPEPGDHVLVYQTASTNEALVPALRRLPHEFRVYGMGREGTEGNASLRPFSRDGFLEDLRTAKAVVAGGGFSLMGEAVHLRVPMLSIPLRHQPEQQLNALYLERLGFGERADAATPEAIAGFLDRIDAHREALEAWIPQDNGKLFATVDDLLARIARGEPQE